MKKQEAENENENNSSEAMTNYDNRETLKNVNSRFAGC